MTLPHYHCRKHHCAVHPVPTNTLMMDPKLKQAYDPKSIYDEKFPPREYQPVERRGLAIPARVIPQAPPTFSMDLLSMTSKDFVQKPLSHIEKCVSKNNLKTPRAAFQDSTSYKSHYPTRIFNPNPMSLSLMRTTMPRIVEVEPKEYFLTTNQCHLKEWGGKNRSTAYKELQEPPFFSGDFQKETVTATDYSGAAVKGGRPGTSCKKTPIKQAPGDFNDITTNKVAFRFPIIDKRDPVHLKGHSQVMEETMAPTTGKMESLTQYRHDNPGFYFRTSKRSAPPPNLEKLVLFKGTLREESEHTTRFKDIPSSMATSGTDGRETFDNDKKQHLLNNSVNKTDYFRFWKTKPRVRYGDSCERVYHPSERKFDAETETQASFPPIRNGKAAKQCESLDVRFGNKAPKHARTFDGKTAYKMDYAPRPFPKAEICPVEAMLQKA